METVTLVSLNTKGYYSSALYLLRDYALQDDAIRYKYTFKLIDTIIVYSGKQRSYSITMLERIQDFLLVMRRASTRAFISWIKAQLRYSKIFHGAARSILWWWNLFRILATRPKIIGFSCYIWNVTSTLRLARWIKCISPRTIIMLGGQEVTNTGNEFIRKYPYIDFVVDGEGEETFRTVLHLLLSRDKRELRDIPGLIGHYDKTCKKRRPLENLESIPSPFTSYRDEPIMLRKIRRSNLGYMIETSRGCPFKCSFCFESNKFKAVRHFPLTKVADEINGMSFLGIRRFHILDPVLCNSDSKQLRALAEIIRQAKGGSNTEFSVEMYAELLNENMLDSLDVFSAFDVGLQSYNPHVLKKINRYFHKKKFTHGIDLLKKKSRHFAVYLIYGLPGETVFSFIKSIQYVLSLQPPELFINHLCVLRGTPLRENASQEKLKYSLLPPYRVKSTGDMSAEDVEMCSDLCNSLMKEFKAIKKGM